MLLHSFWQTVIVVQLQLELDVYLVMKSQHAVKGILLTFLSSFLTLIFVPYWGF